MLKAFFITTITARKQSPQTKYKLNKPATDGQWFGEIQISASNSIFSTLLTWIRYQEKKRQVLLAACLWRALLRACMGAWREKEPTTAYKSKTISALCLHTEMMMGISGVWRRLWALACRNLNWKTWPFCLKGDALTQSTLLLLFPLKHRKKKNVKTSLFGQF